MNLQNADIDRLQLIRSPRIGPVAYRKLMSRFGNAEQALSALPNLAARGGGNYNVIARSTVEQEIEAVAALDASYVFLDDPEYPPLLAELDNAPAAITYRGDLSIASRMSLAMVGARNASAGACKFARTLAHEIGARDCMVISGLARGIDSAAHSGAIKSGTIAVIAGGIDVAYPPQNADLQEQIAQNGLLIAEQAPGVKPHARHFPHRNRIIAGLALGTLVVEAAPKSGSLITARLAAEAGRHVMAIPGSPIDPRARGCNQLIREGGTLVQDADDILDLLKPMDDRFTPAKPLQSSFLAQGETAPEASEGDRQNIVDLIGHSYVEVDELLRQSGAEASVVQLVLLELELAGRLERGAGAKIRLMDRSDEIEA